MRIVETRQLLPTSPGTSRSLEIIIYRGSKPGPKVYIQAGLHAEEAPGYLVLHYLSELLEQADRENRLCGEFTLVPAANPIGLSQWREGVLQGRFDWNNSRNFNRQFPDLTEAVANRIDGRLSSDPRENITLIRRETGACLAALKPIDETESLKLALLERSHGADLVLDLHCDQDASLHLYLGTPLWPEAADLAAWTGAEVVLLASHSGGTPFDEANSAIWWQLAERFPDHPIPPACLAATIEYRGLADTDPERCRDDARRLLGFLHQRGCLDGDPEATPPLRVEPTPLTAVDFLKAEVAGIVSYLKRPGDRVKLGETIARILNPLAEGEEQQHTEVRTITEGILFCRNLDRLARPGRILAKVAGTKPLREESGSLLPP